MLRVFRRINAEIYRDLEKCCQIFTVTGPTDREQFSAISIRSFEQTIFDNCDSSDLLQRMVSAEQVFAVNRYAHRASCSENQ